MSSSEVQLGPAHTRSGRRSLHDAPRGCDPELVARATICRDGSEPRRHARPDRCDAPRVEDLVAVAVELDSGDTRFFMTWGRIQDEVDPGPLQALVLHHAASFDLGGIATAARVCDSLQEAKDARYFFEGIFDFAQRPIPFGAGYPAWRAEMAEALEQGEHLYYLGR